MQVINSILSVTQNILGRVMNNFLFFFVYPKFILKKKKKNSNICSPLFVVLMETILSKSFAMKVFNDYSSPVFIREDITNETVWNDWEKKEIVCNNPFYFPMSWLMFRRVTQCGLKFSAGMKWIDYLQSISRSAAQYVGSVSCQKIFLFRIYLTLSLPFVHA